jgi:hypothetical protein
VVKAGHCAGKGSGNRQVSRLSFLAEGADLSGAFGKAYPEEGGSWGKPGFPQGSGRHGRDAMTGGGRRDVAA